VISYWLIYYGDKLLGHSSGTCPAAHVLRHVEVGEQSDTNLTEVLKRTSITLALWLWRWRQKIPMKGHMPLPNYTAYGRVNWVLIGARTSDLTPGMNFHCIVCGKRFKHYVLHVTGFQDLAMLWVQQNCSIKCGCHLQGKLVRRRMQPDIRSHYNNKGGSKQEVSIQYKGSVARPAHWAKSPIWLTQPKYGDCNGVKMVE
jgi:hypothetical protein